VTIARSLRIAAVSTLVAGFGAASAAATVHLWARCLEAIDLFAVVAASIA
jgi:hypothetical protein